MVMMMVMVMVMMLMGDAFGVTKEGAVGTRSAGRRLLVGVLNGGARKGFCVLF
jgi:hypothetical protein